MHTKINTHQNDPNFLTHVLWSKTNIGMQHIHLGLLWILIYEITKKNKNISRINISGNYKIMINSLEMYLGITKQHAQVGHQNINIFSYKNHLSRFCINGKQLT
jgi:hypothetical protein